MPPKLLNPALIPIVPAHAGAAHLAGAEDDEFRDGNAHTNAQEHLDFVFMLRSSYNFAVLLLYLLSIAIQVNGRTSASLAAQMPRPPPRRATEERTMPPEHSDVASYPRHLHLCARDQHKQIVSSCAWTLTTEETTKQTNMNMPELTNTNVGLSQFLKKQT